MGVSRGDIDDGEFLTADVVFDGFCFVCYCVVCCVVADVTEADDSSAAHDEELFIFGMVPVVALGDAGLGDVDGNLAPVWGFEEFRKGSSLIGVHLEVVSEHVLWQEA